MMTGKKFSTVRNIGLVTCKHGFLTPLLVQIKNTVLIYVCSFGCTLIFKCLLLHAHVGRFLSRFCDYSRPSTSVAPHVRSVSCHELVNIQLPFDNQYIFGTPHCFHWKTPFCKILISPRPTWLSSMWVWLVTFWVQIIEVSDNRGSDVNQGCTVQPHICSLKALYYVSMQHLLHPE